jgi:hypothetical protein
MHALACRHASPVLPRDTAIFIRLIIRIFLLVSSGGTAFFSHHKSQPNGTIILWCIWCMDPGADGRNETGRRGPTACKCAARQLLPARTLRFLVQFLRRPIAPSESLLPLATYPRRWHAHYCCCRTPDSQFHICHRRRPFSSDPLYSVPVVYWFWSRGWSRM